MIAYWNGEYLPLESIRVSPEDRGFLFGDSLYEGILAHHGRLFRGQEHLRRLAEGARQVGFNRQEFPELLEVGHELLRRNSLTSGNAFYYIQVTRGVAPRGHAFPPSDTPLSVYGRVTPLADRSRDLREGVAAILVPDQRGARCDIKSTSLINSVLASQRAAVAGAFEALFVRDGFVLEGTHTSFFAVFDGVLTTSRRSPYILEGVTRRALLDLAREAGIPIAQRPVSEQEIQQAEELFVAGTTTLVTPVIELSGQPIAGGTPGPITMQLQRGLLELLDE